MKHILTPGCLLLSGSINAQYVLPAAIQIKTALLVAPEDQRANATVSGYNSAENSLP